MILEFLVTYLLPAGYAILFGWWMIRSRLFQKSGIPVSYRLFFLYGKIFAGLLYTWLMLKFIPTATADIELFFGGGLEMYKVFWMDPAGFPAYIREIFTIRDFRIGHTDSEFIRRVFDGIKVIHFLLNFLSGGQLFTNVLLFNGIAAFVFLRCWVYLKHYFGRWDLGAWVFLFPSAFFFTSVILKEGIELTLISLIVPGLIHWNNGWKPARAFGLLVLFFLLFFFKYLIAFTFLAALLLYKLFQAFPQRKVLVAISASLLFILFFFTARYIHPSLDLPQYIIERRVEFQELDANSRLEMLPLKPTPGSFLRVLPEALHNTLLRPWPGEGGKKAYLVFSAEILAFWLCILVGLAVGVKMGLKSPGPEAWAFLLFALVNLVIIGYTITNMGSIIRYRSIFLPGIGYFLWVLYCGNWAIFKIGSAEKRT